MATKQLSRKTADDSLVAKTTEVPRHPNELKVHAKEGEHIADALARGAIRPTVLAALTIRDFSGETIGGLDLEGLIGALSDQAKAVQAGNMQRAEIMLISQAHTLNTIFAELARRAALNMDEHLGAMETYMLLALKAQSQSRSTIETLAEIKNPRSVAFVKQANIAHGPQVNNGQDSFETSTRPRMHAGENSNQTNELSGTVNELLPDARASQAASRIDTEV